MSESAVEDDTIVVLEIWESKEHHAAALELLETRPRSPRRCPMLTGEFTGQELDVLGGLGVSSRGGEPTST